MKKLKSRSGETLVETLVAVLILVVIMLMLPISIVTAAKINAAAKKQVTVCSMDRGSPAANGTVKLTDSSGAATIVGGVKGYEDTGFYFYEYED